MLLKSILPVQLITAESMDDYIASAELIVADLAGPKVMQGQNGNMIKLFRRKRRISSAAVAPYAVRFCNNALRLKELDIPTVTPVALFHCRQRQIHMVEYQPLPGQLLRGLLQNSKDDALFLQTAKFIALLHKRGIYFRSLHFENIVYHEGRLGLIDVADMRIFRKPLGRSLQQRNFMHFMRYPQDAALIKGFGIEKFEAAYQQDLKALVND